MFSFNFWGLLFCDPTIYFDKRLDESNTLVFASAISLTMKDICLCNTVACNYLSIRLTKTCSAGASKLNVLTIKLQSLPVHFGSFWGNFANISLDENSETQRIRVNDFQEKASGSMRLIFEFNISITFCFRLRDIHFKCWKLQTLIVTFKFRSTHPHWILERFWKKKSCLSNSCLLCTVLLKLNNTILIF